MKAPYVLAPQAARDLVGIWRYVLNNSSRETADKIETAIISRIQLLANNPEAGHLRRDLTSLPVKFFPVYSYLIVYRPETTPLQVVAILHGRRDIQQILKK